MRTAAATQRGCNGAGDHLEAAMLLAHAMPQEGAAGHGFPLETPPAPHSSGASANTGMLLLLVCCCVLQGWSAQATTCAVFCLQTCLHFACNCNCWQAEQTSMNIN